MNSIKNCLRVKLQIKFVKIGRFLWKWINLNEDEDEIMI
jgi:hypothetical protein